MVETERLKIIPLTYGQLVKYSLADNSLEKELNLNKSLFAIAPELKEALEQIILPNVADSTKDYLFCTLWTIISKEENVMIGDLCFTGEPDELGQVEIGYGTHEKYRNRGFMTEAVGGIINWASTQNKLTAVIASTEKSNIASSSVLEKNNFKKIGETSDLFKWRWTTACG